VNFQPFLKKKMTKVNVNLKKYILLIIKELFFSVNLLYIL